MDSLVRVSSPHIIAIFVVFLTIALVVRLRVPPEKRRGAFLSVAGLAVAVLAYVTLGGPMTSGRDQDRIGGDTKEQAALAGEDLLAGTPTMRMNSLTVKVFLTVTDDRPIHYYSITGPDGGTRIFHSVGHPVEVPRSWVGRRIELTYNEDGSPRRLGHVILRLQDETTAYVDAGDLLE